MGGVGLYGGVSAVAGIGYTNGPIRSSTTDSIHVEGAYGLIAPTYGLSVDIPIDNPCNPSGNVSSPRIPGMGKIGGGLGAFVGAGGARTKTIASPTLNELLAPLIDFFRN